MNKSSNFQKKTRAAISIILPGFTLMMSMEKKGKHLEHKWTYSNVTKPHLPTTTKTEAKDEKGNYGYFRVLKYASVVVVNLNRS